MLLAPTIFRGYIIKQKNGWPTNLLEETIQACDAITFTFFGLFYGPFYFFSLKFFDHY